MTAKYALISASRDDYELAVMCSALNVSPSGYHAAQRRPASARAMNDEGLRLAVRLAHARSRRRYGAPRIQHALRTAGTCVATKRVARLMREDGLVARRPGRRVRTTTATPSLVVAPNLLARQFAVPTQAGLDRVWTSDITYVPTREGWLFLAVVLDVASRRVVGWAMRDTLEEALVLDALEMALTQRRPARGLLHHSDRGSQYAGGAYRAQLTAHGVTCSMSRKGNCWDNAVAESFFATLEHELLADADFSSRQAAQRAIFEFIEVWYNRERLHSTLGYLSPVQYEAAHAAA